jgi:hypothetical protein
MRIRVLLSNGVVLEKDRFDMTIMQTCTGPIGVTMFDEEWCAVWDPDLSAEAPLPLHYAVRTEKLSGYICGTDLSSSEGHVSEVRSAEFY